MRIDICPPWGHTYNYLFMRFFGDLRQKLVVQLTQATAPDAPNPRQVGESYRGFN